MKRLCMFFVLFFAFGILLSEPKGFDFSLVSDQEIGHLDGAGLFPASQILFSGKNKLWTYPTLDTYRFSNRGKSPLRVIGTPFFWGIGDNRLGCMDLVSSKIVWECYLDSPILNMFQLDDKVVALSVKSLYAFNIVNGRPEWQISNSSGEKRPQIQLSRDPINRRLPSSGNEALLKEFGMNGMPRLAIGSGGEFVALSTDDGSIVAIGKDGVEISRKKVSSLGDPQGAMFADGKIQDIYSSTAGMYILFKDRRFGIFDKNMDEGRHIYLPGTDVTYLREMNDKIVFLEGGSFYSWKTEEESYKKVDIEVNEVGAFIPGPDQDIYANSRDGFACFDMATLRIKWVKSLESTTVWVGIIPVKGSQYAWEVFTWPVGGETVLVLACLDTLYSIDASTGKILSKTKLFAYARSPRAINNVGQSLLGSYYVPPYIDAVNRTCYLAVVEIQGIVNSALDSHKIVNHVAAIKW